MIQIRMLGLDWDLQTDQYLHGVCLGFICSRGRLRPSQKPPETTKKKSSPSLGNQCSFVLAITIFLIAFYLNSNLIRKAISKLQLNSERLLSVNYLSVPARAMSSNPDISMPLEPSSNDDANQLPTLCSNQLKQIKRSFWRLLSDNNRPYSKQNDPIERNNPKPMPGLRT